jgi:hypothetical protein
MKATILFSIFMLLIKCSFSQSIPLSDLENLQDSTIDFAVNYLGENGWSYKGYYSDPQTDTSKEFALKWQNTISTTNIIYGLIIIIAGKQTSRVNEVLLNFSNRIWFQQLTGDIMEAGYQTTGSSPAPNSIKTDYSKVYKNDDGSTKFIRYIHLTETEKPGINENQYTLEMNSTKISN